MPLVAAKCTQCGANLQIDSSKDAAICPNCNTPFVTEKAITNYKTYYEYKIEKADVHIHDEKSVETRLKNAEIFFKKHNNIDKAYELFHSVANDAPGDYRGWWGLVRVKTDDFYLSEISRKELKKLNYYTTCAFNVASEDVLDKLKREWEPYLKTVIQFQDEVVTDYNELVIKYNNTNNEIDNLTNEVEYVSDEIYQSAYKYDNRKRKEKYFLIPLCFFGFLSLTIIVSGQILVLPPFLFCTGIAGIPYIIFKVIQRQKKNLIQEKEEQKAQLYEAITESRETAQNLWKQITEKKRFLN